jgi:hypothetical protein
MGVQCVHFRQPQAPCSSLFGVPFGEEELSAEKRELSCASPTEGHDRHSCCSCSGGVAVVLVFFGSAVVLSAEKLATRPACVLAGSRIILVFGLAGSVIIRH